MWEHSVGSGEAGGAVYCIGHLTGYGLLISSYNSRLGSSQCRVWCGHMYICPSDNSTFPIKNSTPTTTDRQCCYIFFIDNSTLSVTKLSPTTTDRQCHLKFFIDNLTLSVTNLRSTTTDRQMYFSLFIDNR